MTLRPEGVANKLAANKTCFREFVRNLSGDSKHQQSWEIWKKALVDHFVLSSLLL